MVKLTKLGQFLGEFRHNLTEKNRLALPKQIRVEIDGYQVILTRGFDKCLAGYDLGRWKQMAQQPLSIPAFEQQGRELRRQLFATARVIELDMQGRLVIPDTHLVWAGLKGKIGEEVLIIGAGDHFEIWQSQMWQTQVSALYKV